MYYDIFIIYINIYKNNKILNIISEHSILSHKYLKLREKVMI